MTSKENMELIFQHKQPEWIPHFGDETYSVRDYIVERPIRATGYDAWGCHWISCPDSLGYTFPDIKDVKFSELSEWREKVKFPDLENLDSSSMVEGAKAYTGRDSKLLQYISLNGIFERSHILMGFENLLVQCMENPDEFSEFLRALAGHKISLFQKVYDICRPDVLLYHDDIAMQSSPFFSNDFYIKYIFPHYTRIAAAAGEIGYRYVMHHSCGRIENLIPDWLACGFDGWDSVMPCNDLPAIKRDYGDKIVFIPGMDTQEVLGNPDSTRSDIEKMVVRWMEMLAGDGTGLLIDTNSSLSLNETNEAICLEFIRKHGKLFMDAKKAGEVYIPDYE